ncbi:MAG: hypothetical protein JW730_07090 [Anaerolineales bacterium]|nr:hypothetical protein [Anaerolineales bacterium]
MENYKTLTGMSMNQVYEHLDRELPAGAYKEIKGSHGKDGKPLTDIDPNYATDVLNEIFGVCGVGWGYDYDSHDLSLTVETRKTRSGDTRRVCTAILSRMSFWYKLLDDQEVKSFVIVAGGASDNDDEAYAIKGATTYALGNAISKLGWQKSVYQGARSHMTVKSGTKATTAVKAGATPAPKPTPKAAKAKASDDEIVDDPPLNAAAFVIPSGNRKGQVLGDQSLDVIKWYAESLKPANESQKALQCAAQQLLKVRSNGHEPVAA